MSLGKDRFRLHVTRLSPERNGTASCKLSRKSFRASLCMVLSFMLKLKPQKSLGSINAGDSWLMAVIENVQGCCR